MMFETTKRERHYLIMNIFYSMISRSEIISKAEEKDENVHFYAHFYDVKRIGVFSMSMGVLLKTLIWNQSALHSENTTSVCCATSLTLKYTCDRRNPVKLNYRLFWWKYISKSSIYLKYIMNNADTSEIITYRLH